MKTTFVHVVFCSLVALTSLVTTSVSAQCRDPWVTSAIKEVYGRNPVGRGEFCDCNIRLYNNGSWNSYAQLKGFVQEVKNSGLQMGYAITNNGNAVMVVKLGNQMAASMLNASGQIVAAGGGNIVAAGGGNIVAAGGGNIVAAGGGNFRGLSRGTPGFQFSGGYQTLSTGQSRLKTSGNGAIVVTP